MTTETTLRIALDTAGSPLNEVSGILTEPPDASACLVFAHGAGAGMRHPFMARAAVGLAERGLATLRYQFPYMESGSRRPDGPAVAHAAVRAAVRAAREHSGAARLFAGGKSFGGRMTSQAQALEPLPGVAGLVFLGFPLHPAGKPSLDRADHLQAIDVPMLFVHGGRDALAEPDLFERAVANLAEMASVVELEHADHSFHVPKRAGDDDEVLDDVLDAIAVWTQAWRI